MIPTRTRFCLETTTESKFCVQLKITIFSGDVSDQKSFGFDIDQYTSSSVYCGFNDGPKGFFSVYKDLFMKILIEEEDARLATEENELNVPSYLEAPKFGLQGEPLDKVAAFYHYWETFATVKSFAWADKYRHEKDHNRYVRRLIDQDNKKSRKKAKRNYLDKIR